MLLGINAIYNDSYVRQTTSDKNKQNKRNEQQQQQQQQKWRRAKPRLTIMAKSCTSKLKIIRQGRQGGDCGGGGLVQKDVCLF